LALLALAGPGTAQAVSTQARRAFLVRGPAPVKGLPFFAPNVLPGLAGEYSLVEPRVGEAGAAEFPVWYTRASIVLASTWKRAEAYGPGAFLLGRGPASVLLIRTSRCSLFFELPPSAAPDAPDSRQRAFIGAFVKKFTVFFDNAATDAELSFPAYVDY